MIDSVFVVTFFRFLFNAAFCGLLYVLLSLECDELKQSRASLLGMPLDTGLTPGQVLEHLGGSPVLLSYLNPFAWAIARRDTDYLENLEKMDLVVCDGIAIQKATRRFLGQETSIISLDYSGIGQNYLKLLQQRGSRICLVGSTEANLLKAKLKLKTDFPSINIIATFPGYENGPEDARDFILEREPDFVLAGLGMGQQERFLLALREQGWPGTGICVGAFIDRLANPDHDYPAWSVRLRVRFLGNLSRRPFYYLRRYCVDYLPFLKQYMLQALRKPESKD